MILFKTFPSARHVSTFPDMKIVTHRIDKVKLRAIESETSLKLVHQTVSVYTTQGPVSLPVEWFEVMTWSQKHLLQRMTTQCV